MSTEHTTPPALPPEVSGSVRLAIASAAKSTPECDRVAIVASVLTALAPLWPRPAPVTAPRIEDNLLHRYVTDPRNDGSYELHLGPEETRKLWDEIDRLVTKPAAVTDARELADRVVTRIEGTFRDWLMAGERSKAIEEVAAVLAPVVARAEAAEREAAEVRKAWNDREPQLLAAERERDQLRAEIVHLEKNLYTGDDDEKRDLRADIDRLNAEVAVLEGQLAASEKQLAARREGGAT